MDWAEYYQLTGQGGTTGQEVSSDTGLGTTPAIAPSGTTSPTASSSHLNPEGRVSKPARRRRASRAAPTTLVNTDTSNFRAMVQQFTGVSNPTLSFGSRSDAQNIDFRTARNPYQQPQQQQQQQQQHLLLQQQQQQQQGYMYSSYSNTRPTLEGSDGFLLGNNNTSSSSSQMFPRPNSHNNRNNGYIQ